MKRMARVIRLLVLSGGLFFALGVHLAMADFIFDLAGTAGPDGGTGRIDLTAPVGGLAQLGSFNFTNASFLAHSVPGGIGYPYTTSDVTSLSYAIVGDVLTLNLETNVVSGVVPTGVDPGIQNHIVFGAQGGALPSNGFASGSHCSNPGPQGCSAFFQGTFSSSLVSPAPSNGPSHDSQVADTILTFLNQTDKALPLEQRALNAWTAILSARTQPGKSTDPTLRDAEYFMITFWASQTPNPIAALVKDVAFLATIDAYVSAKAVLDVSIPKLEQGFRITNNPVSPPGGFDWALAGAQAGILGRLSPDDWGIVPTNSVHPMPPTDVRAGNLNKMGTFLGPVGVNGLGTTQPLFLDPTPGGFTYRILASSTEFRTILLPLGTFLKGGSATLSFDGQVFQLAPGVVFDFTANGSASGTQEFSLFGLDSSDGFDTTDGRLFVLGLTFTDPADLAFIDVEPLATPEPATLLLFGTAMAGLGLAARSRH